MPADNWMACTSAAGASHSIVLQSQAAILLGVVGGAHNLTQCYA